MSRIKIDIATDEFEFVKEAIAYKSKALIDYLDRCKAECEIKDVEINGFNNALREMIDNPTFKKLGRPRKTVRRTRNAK
jgi:hypothetical protein